jgi:hypothetical protein
MTAARAMINMSKTYLQQWKKEVIPTKMDQLPEPTEGR